MNLITIIACDRDSSDTMSRTFHTDSMVHFKKNVEAFENGLPFRKYELIADEMFISEDHSEELIETLNELDITF